MVQPETTQCHSEPFGWLGINSADPFNHEILRRPPSAGLLRMTSENTVAGWTLVNCKLRNLWFGKMIIYAAWKKLLQKRKQIQNCKINGFTWTSFG